MFFLKIVIQEEPSVLNCIRVISSVNWGSIKMWMILSL